MIGNIKIKVKYFNLVLLLCFPLLAIASPVIDNRNGYNFTKNIGPFKFYRKLDFKDPRLGYGLNYRTSGGIKQRSIVTIIIYDLGMKNITAGISDQRVIKQFENAFRDIKTFVSRGNYKSVKRLDQSSVKNKDYLALNMLITIPRGLTLKSNILMRGHNGKFIKIRISGPNNAESDKLALTVLKQISLILGLKR
ncbi:hypothetical protein MNBD_GAMMA12-796 [hydrothermal vent metagenome]|uniref:Uncharacterized protein n=1 Tax=hydrothermal vent metagenome TaxID=652676 RepID=A0A3B0YMA3_9ZZZZ